MVTLPTSHSENLNNLCCSAKKNLVVNSGRTDKYLTVPANSAQTDFQRYYKKYDTKFPFLLLLPFKQGENGQSDTSHSERLAGVSMAVALQLEKFTPLAD